MSKILTPLRRSFDQLPEFPSTTTSVVRSRILRIGVLTAILVLLLHLCSSLSYYEDGLEDAETDDKPGYLHLLIPASKPDQNLCKTVLSAGILNYPAPRLVNWNQKFEDPNLVAGGSHIGKISGIKAYLDGMDVARDSDLVLMVDGYDVWFQLRPQTILDRYCDINRRANKRVQKELGDEVVRQHNIHQQIVFSCQKRCWLFSEDDPECYAVPQSSLPQDIYGPETDTDIGDEKNPYIKFRQRFLNSGVAIGTVGAMRKLFTEAMVRAEHDPNFGSDQKIFSQLFAEQEVAREALRQQSLSNSWWSRLTSSTYSDERIRRFKKEHLDAVQGKDLEFGLGVDYESSIGLATVFAEDDTEWLTPSNKEELDQANAVRAIDTQKSRLGNVLKDVAGTVPPFWTFERKPLPREQTWSDVSLFTDVWTGIAPAVIHHNAHRDGMKSLREEWWDRIWFQEHARSLYDSHIVAPLGPVAISGGRQWWSSEDWKGGARVDPQPLTNDTWIRYEEMCDGTEDEVFRDGGGPWRLPDDH
ncbi:hypothetical protein D6D02_07932 [Aureobasidium pullulans]|nr:hypothetical protein D6D02_07932 [Aureobasidium pullulans]